MSWNFDEYNDHVTFSDDSLFDWPNGDWTISLWLNMPDNSGTGFQYFWSHGTVGANNSMNLYWYEASYSSSTRRNKLRVNMLDAGGGDAFQFNSNSTEASNFINQWGHLVIRRTSGICQMYRNGTYIGGQTNTSVATVSPSGNFRLGARADLNSTRYYGGKMAEVAVWHTALTTAEIGALADGYSPEFFRHRSGQWYLPMNLPLAGVGLKAQWHAGKKGAWFSGAAKHEDHPPIIYPNTPVLGKLGWQHKLYWYVDENPYPPSRDDLMSGNGADLSGSIIDPGVRR